LTRGRVLVDIQGTQSIDHRDRGVARYIIDLASALHERHGERVGPFLLNPDRTPPAGIEPFVAAGALATIDEIELRAGDVYHVASPYELSVPLHRLWPTAAREAGLRLAVTLYDVIPEVFAEQYLADPGLRRRYRARHHLVRQADAVLAISQATADDAVERLGLDPAKVTVIGGAVAAHFLPPADRAAAATAARRAVPGLADRYLLYTGGMEHRKNIDGLLEAYSRLPPEVRAQWQLVIVCHVQPSTRHHYEVMAERLGIGDRLLLTGFVPEDALVLLYQGTDLFVFPSLYEGYGLPVMEAVACGAPAIASAGSSLDEITVAEARFDPYDPGAIAAAIERGLTDPATRAALEDAARRPPPSWDDVADRTAAAYDDLLARPASPRRRRARPRIAFVTPLPPQRTGVAIFSVRLLEHLRDDYDVDVFVDGPLAGPLRDHVAPKGLDVYPADWIHRIEGCVGGYDAVVYSIGNSEFHGGALGALRRRPGLVLAHDVRLVELYYHGANRPGSVTEGFAAAVQEMYRRRVPDDLAVSGRLEPEEADRWGIVMAREIVARSTRFLATSRFAADLARLDADLGDRHKIDVVPFAVHPPVPPDGTERVLDLVATFGVVNEIKQPSKIVRALAEPPLAGVRLAVVGPASVAERERLVGLAEALGVADRVELTGELDDAIYEGWLRRAAVAVQLRASANGESSGAVGDCMAAGVPAIVTSLGAARDLPDECALKVAPDVSPAELAATVADLLEDGARRAAMSAAAVAYAEAHSFAALADALADVLP